MFKVAINSLLLFASSVLIISCGDSKEPRQLVGEVNDEVKKRANAPRLPDACKFITTNELKQIIGVDAEVEVSIKDATTPQNPFARSCFFRWEDDGIPNSGALLQIQSNPIPEEYPEWPLTFIKSKLESGEKGFNDVQEVEYKYNKFEDIGIEGAYNYDLRKYFWRIDDEFIYMLAFNLEGTEAEHLHWATQIAKIATPK